jgi:2-amino-4-hydroxy-6-hydroxymethyldihydropteridine diphosphokinase
MVPSRRRDDPHPNPLPTGEGTAWPGATRCWIGLGSNLGDRLDALRRACDRLIATPAVRICKYSSVYESAPWGYLAQPAFLNAVVVVSTTLGPIQLLIRLQTIEHELGRKRRFRWGPREIDLDLLDYGGLSLQRRGLTLPHPAIEQRPFVLVPLRDVSPRFRSRSGESIDQLIARTDPEGQLVRVLEGEPGLLVR